MGENIGLLEQKIAEQRHELELTVAAIAYRADLRHRLPEYAEDAIKSTASAAGTGATNFGKVASKQGALFASYIARAVWWDVRMMLRLARMTRHSALVLIRSGAGRVRLELSQRRRGH